MRIDIVPDDGHWLIVKDFHRLLPQHGPTAFPSRPPGIPEWSGCWAGGDWAPTGERSLRFKDKKAAETYLERHRQSMEQA